MKYLGREYRGNFKISAIVFALLAMATIFTSVMTATAARQKKIADQNVIVDAVLVDYYRIGGTGLKNPEIGFYYRYEDENGKVYKDSTSHYFVYGYEKAEKIIAEKKTIKIYIDDKGNSLPVGAEPSKAKFVTIIVLCSTFAITTVVVLIVFLIPKRQKENEEENK